MIRDAGVVINELSMTVTFGIDEDIASRKADVEHRIRAIAVWWEGPDSEIAWAFDVDEPRRMTVTVARAKQ